MFMPLSVHTMALSGEHSAFVAEESIQNGCSPIMTQRTFRIRLALGRRDPVPDKKKSQLGVELQANRFCIKKEIHWLTSDRNRTGNCGRCDSFDCAISTAFCTETCGCPMVILSKRSENAASTSQDTPLQNCDCTRTE
jgi:hypothetical protein